ncbi:hypothetical protein RRG39_02285 [Mycoplasmopsis cynos]|nr:hypothetical protein [Mycoplasmopsis cynos]WQQ16591.1 hypothetical protein RRG39_02285 [Mycoplasmopsis cynos]
MNDKSNWDGKNYFNEEEEKFGTSLLGQDERFYSIYDFKKP